MSPSIIFSAENTVVDDMTKPSTVNQPDSDRLNNSFKVCVSV